MWQYNYTDELYHYGIPGMKWGHRKARPVVLNQQHKTMMDLKSNYKQQKADYKSQYNQAKKKYKSQYNQAKKDYKNSPEYKAQRKAKIKKAAKIGATVAGTALAAYGAYKLNKFIKDKNVQIAAKNGYERAMKQFKNENENAMRFIDNAKKQGSAAAKYTVRADTKLVSDAANSASKQNFRTAAKNVINYKKNNGSLNDLSSARMYEDMAKSAYSSFGYDKRSTVDSAKKTVKSISPVVNKVQASSNNVSNKLSRQLEIQKRLENNLEIMKKSINDDIIKKGKSYTTSQDYKTRMKNYNDMMEANNRLINEIIKNK